METKKIEIEVPEGKRAEWVNGVLTLVDEAQKDSHLVIERIKTFENACEELGTEHPLVRLWADYPYIGLNDQAGDVVAYMKLRIIAAALNEGWKPQFAKDEWRYFPRFELYTQKEIDRMDKEQKSCIVCRPSDNVDVYGGISYVSTAYGTSHMFTSISSQITFKTRELAEYAGKQFIELYADFVFNN